MPNIKESGLRVNAENFAIEVELSRFHKYSYIFLFKVYRHWKRVVRRHVGIRANPVGFERCCYVKNLFSPFRFTYPSRT